MSQELFNHYTFTLRSPSNFCLRYKGRSRDRAIGSWLI